MRQLGVTAVMLAAVCPAWLGAAEAAAPAVAEIQIRKDIVYGRAGGVDLKLDLAVPASGAGPFPAILYFHGGGWQAGNKWHGHGWIRAFAAQGYVGASVGYRFAPEFKWPAQVHDAKAAVRYLRAHARELNLDPERIGAAGDSAGAYLALMLGVTDPRDGLEGDGGNPGFSSRVQAVATYYTATDFTNLGKSKPDPKTEADTFKYYKKSIAEVMTDFLGTKDPADPILKKISALPYVDRSDAPTIIFQGDADPIVRPEHAELLDRAMTAAGVSHELVMVPGGGHGWTGKLRDATNLQTAAFFARELKTKPQSRQ